MGGGLLSRAPRDWILIAMCSLKLRHGASSRRINPLSRRGRSCKARPAKADLQDERGAASPGAVEDFRVGESPNRNIHGLHAGV